MAEALRSPAQVDLQPVGPPFSRSCDLPIHGYGWHRFAPVAGRRADPGPTSCLLVFAGFALVAGLAAVLARWPHPLWAALAVCLVASALACVSFRLATVALLRTETEARAYYEGILQASPDVVLVTDADLTVVAVSGSVREVLHIDESEVVGRSLLELIVVDDRPQVSVALATAVASRPAMCEARLRRADGSSVQAELAVRNVVDDPAVGGVIITVRDVSNRVAIATQLHHRAFHDPLTNLANRSLFLDRLEHALAGDEPRAAVLLLDLDGFKQVNDTLGHEVGDALLAGVAQRLRGCVEPSDTVARLGGDEFAILLTGNRGSESAALDVAFRVADALSAPIPVGDERPRAQTSVGIAGAVAGSTAAELLRNADLAMYRAKAAGKNRAEIFHSEMHREAAVKLQLEREFRAATADAQWLVQYQPIVDLESGGLHAVEALLRWNHPARGLLAPATFIPLAEETGLIVEIGEWVLNEACSRVAGWQRRGLSPGLGLCVNVSARQFEDPLFVDRVRDALERSGLAMGTLTLEVTEGLLASGDDGLRDSLLELHRIGVRLAVDDFGTGLTSLGSLNRYPVHTLKIDRSFVSRLTWPDPEAPALARTIVAMGRALRLEVVAEGVETAEQQAQLRSLGCRLGQGFGIARPLNVPALEQWLVQDGRGQPFPDLLSERSA